SRSGTSRTGRLVRGRNSGPRTRARRARVRGPGCSDGADVLGFLALAAGCDVEFDALAFFEAAVAVALDCREVHEDVISAFARDEAEALLAVEPFHGACCHDAA